VQVYRPAKQADQPSATDCPVWVPVLGVPVVEDLMSRRPSSLRDAPSRPLAVRNLAVHRTFQLGGGFLCGLPHNGFFDLSHGALRLVKLTGILFLTIAALLRFLLGIKAHV
jgi:hypothetical protein